MLQKLGDGHCRGAGNGGVGRQGGQGDGGGGVDLGDGAFGHRGAHLIEQHRAGFGHDVADDDVLGIVSVEDGDASVADVPADFADHGSRVFVADAGLGKQGAGGLGMGHVGRVGDHGAAFDEHVVDGGGGAIAFEAADVAAVAGPAVDVDGDVADFGGGTEEAVDEATVVDDAEAHAFADQIIGEVAVGVHRRDNVRGLRRGRPVR